MVWIIIAMHTSVAKVIVQEKKKAVLTIVHLMNVCTRSVIIVEMDMVCTVICTMIKGDKI